MTTVRDPDGLWFSGIRSARTLTDSDRRLRGMADWTESGGNTRDETPHGFASSNDNGP